MDDLLLFLFSCLSADSIKERTQGLLFDILRSVLSHVFENSDDSILFEAACTLLTSGFPMNSTVRDCKLHYIFENLFISRLSS